MSAANWGVWRGGGGAKCFLFGPKCPRTKLSFSLEISILGLKISFWIENFNPRPCFSVVREGPRMKKPFLD